VQEVCTRTTAAENHARNAADAYKEARELLAKVQAKPQSPANDALIKQLAAIAPEAPAGGGGGGGRGGRGGGGGGGFGAPAEPPPAPTLVNIGALLVGAVQPMQSSEMPATAAQLQACDQQEAAYNTLIAKWAALKAKVNGGPAPAAAKKQ
jgi:hypothetical protein